MSLQVTELSEIYKIDGATINDIHAIYLEKRQGSRNNKGKRWSPSASCLIASLMTGVPEHFVQQIIVHFLKYGHNKVCYTYFDENDYNYKLCYSEKFAEMEAYFQNLNTTKRDTWDFNEFDHPRDLARELENKVKTKDIISSHYDKDDPPISIPDVVSIFNFYVMNTRNSMLAMSKVFEIYPEPDQEIFMESLHNIIKAKLFADGYFSDHCREAKKILKYKSGPEDGKLVSTIIYVAFQFNLPIPLKESWVDSLLWSYHYYCANIFWPLVIDVFRTQYGKQELKILGNLREIMISIANADKGLTLRRGVFDKVIGRKIISEHDELNIVEILTIDFDESPKSNMIINGRGRVMYTYAEHYERAFGLKVQDLGQPLIIVDPNYGLPLIPEFCSMVESSNEGPSGLNVDFKNLKTIPLFPKEIGKVPICCQRCKPNNVDSSVPLQGKLFENFNDLERHNADHHGFDCLFNAKNYQEFHPNQVLKQRWHFRQCVNCDKLCLNDESYELHINLEHNPQKADEAKKHLQMIMETNKDKIDKKIQRQQLVESILKIHEKEKKEKDSKTPNSWKTEGDPEAYDVDKVLEELNEGPSNETKKKKKKRKNKNKKSRCQENDLSIEVSEVLKELEAIEVKADEPRNDDSERDLEGNPDDCNIQGAARLPIGPVEEYIDSIEQENRNWKVFQSFYEGMKSENETLRQKLKEKERSTKESVILEEKLKERERSAVAESRLCKICMENEMEITFLPCGHLMSCINCAPVLKNCPICRRPIKGSVRTYL